MQMLAFFTLPISVGTLENIKYLLHSVHCFKMSVGTLENIKYFLHSVRCFKMPELLTGVYKPNFV